MVRKREEKRPNGSAARLSQELRAEDRAARRLGWWTAGYLVSVGFMLFVLAGSSQAMRAAWLETVFSITTPALFLVSTRVSRRKPSRWFPYGHHRWTTIAFLGAATSLLGLAIYLLYDAGATLFSSNQPARIESVQVFGVSIWSGWPIFAALAWSAVPAWLIGKSQQRRARRLHDKLLNRTMRQADWMTSAAAAFGVIGISIGWPEADPIAAGLIAIGIFRDAARQLRHVLSDLADSAPTDLDGKLERLPDEVAAWLRDKPWVADAKVRFREEGRLLFGDALVVPIDHRDLLSNISRVVEEVRSAHWRIEDFILMPVPKLPPE